MSVQPGTCPFTGFHDGHEQDDLKKFPGILKTKQENQIDSNVRTLEMLTPGLGWTSASIYFKEMETVSEVKWGTEQCGHALFVMMMTCTLFVI